ncbi:Mg2+ transporter protein, CorA-like/Zinc transport protein ZntB [Akanthomyces lecanii RCEF 1005]|uniref:Mg2+ transporter protein, CorA-like/Zinc transport protein ZntB n=1 Tax=Akanthomyces lecanii RCEF 1005 TaxID=1081108 RepID=A0A168KSD2_CORDF|nr:Mg2+ transporter protein, CorA-like/Zinc transport protein ZntB [Akanthomyces lecanii RCEF 1005]
MSIDAQRMQELLKTVEARHEEYLRSLRQLYENVPPASAVPPRIAAPTTTAKPASIASVPSPPLRALTFASDILPIRGRGRRSSTLEAPERPTFLPPSPRPLLPVTPIPSHGLFDEDISFIPLLDLSHASSTTGAATTASSKPPAASTRTDRTLPPARFADDAFLAFLRDATFTEEMAAVLEEMLRRRHEIDSAGSVREFAAYERERYVSSTFEAYEVDEDGAATKMSIDAAAAAAADDDLAKGQADGDGGGAADDGVIDAPIVWDALKTVNASGDAVGRITIVQEPTPLMLAALQLTMAPYFDMSELTYHLLSDVPNRGLSHAFMHRAFERGPPPQLRQRSFYMVFKYYTSVGDGLAPAPWQRYEARPSDKKLADHIDIAECSAVLALSLAGAPVKSLRMRSRRSERASREGVLYDTFGPWHVLSIQSFPDDEHTVRGEEFAQHKRFVNGPYAFLDLLTAEYRDAGKRNVILHEKITKLITPPTEFMFDRRLRDKLLFEDKHFTYIRRYFWAYNTLAVINTGLAAMVAAYTNTFTPEFWSGTHPLLWPHPFFTDLPSSSSSPPDAATAAAAYHHRETMAALRTELEKAVSDISAIIKRNERTRKEIENLRDQLFSGSSIKESRRAIDQGDNIQILTMISMIFLPLTFVTSVFGITEFTISPTDWRFAVTMVLVCVPFMGLVVLLQTNGFAVLVRRCREGFVAVLGRARSGGGAEAGGSGMSAAAAADDDVSRPAQASSQTKRRKRRMAAAAGGRVSWSWKRPWKNRTRTLYGDENLEFGRV